MLPSSLLTSCVVAPNQRVVVLRNGAPVAWLEPGLHYLWQNHRDVRVMLLDLSQGAINVDERPDLAGVVPTHVADPLEIASGEIALLYREGRAFRYLGPGSYLVWTKPRRIEARLYSTRGVMTQVPEADWGLLPASQFVVNTVHPYEQGLLWIDGEFISELGAGRYGVHSADRKVEVSVVDTREREIAITGQEVMTSDKVTLRLNLIVKFRVREPLVSVSTQSDLQGALYSEAQLVARAYIGATSVDELLEARAAASQEMLRDLEARAASWGVEIVRIDLKDLILPGEMKSLLNQVIEAQKKADAQVIMRREETAATRSQANTARMLENNPMLWRLKELETMREMAESVGSLTIVAGSDDILRLATRKP